MSDRLRKAAAFISRLYNRHKEKFNYAIFGLMTTIVNLTTYHFLMFIPWFSSRDTTVYAFGEEYAVGYLIANAVAFIVSVIFSYWANRNFVFRQKLRGAGAILGQFFVFLGTRLISFAVEEILLFVAVEHIGISEYASKWIVSVLVVVINYAFGKLVVFRPKEA